MARSATVFEASRALEVLSGLQNAAAKFIRKTSHQKSLLFIIIYCLIISNNCIKYVNCDIEPQPMNNISDDDDDAATKQLVSFEYIFVLFVLFFRLFFFFFALSVCSLMVTNLQ